MADGDSGAMGASPLESAIGRLEAHDHLCLLYSSREEQMAAVMPFMRLGLERGERCVYIADQNTADEVLAELAGAGVDVEAARRAGALSVVTKREAYLRTGAFDPDRMIAFLGEAVDEALARGFKALRATGEMTWALGGAPGAERLLEYESKLNDFFPRRPALAICQYDRRRFPAAVIKEVIHTHPLVVAGGMVAANVYFIPNERYLTPERPELEVERLLANIARLQAAEDEVRSAAERHAREIAILEATPDFVSMADTRRRMVYLNPGGRRLVGLGEDEPLDPLRIDDIHPPWALRRVVEEGLPAAQRDGVWRGETALLDRRGREIPVSQVILAHRGRDGALSRYSTVMRDLTEEKRLEAARAHLAAIVENSEDAILSKDLEGRVLTWNEGARRLYGYSAEEMVGRPVSRLFPPDASEEERDILSRLRRGERVPAYETVRLAKDGRRLTVSLTVSPILDARGKVVAASAVARDVSRRVEVEEALRRSEANLNRAQAVAKIGSWHLDLLRNELSWSAENYRIFAVAPGTPMTYEGFLGRVHPDDRALVHEAWSAALSGRPYDIVHRLAVEPVRWVRERAEVEFGPDGRAVSGTGTTQDITEQRRLEAELLQAQKSEAVGLLVGGVAHDFNNLITVIAANCGFLLEQLPPGDPRRDDADQIRSAAERAALLTRQLLIFSRRDVARPERVDLAAVIVNLRKMLGRLLGEDIVVDADLAVSQAWVLADAGQLEQMLMNLAANARDAMPDGGRFTLRLREAGSGAAPRLLLEVSDSGCGMPPEVLERAFEPFFTTKPPGKGTGLGLSTVQTIVRQAGGRVTARSRVGGGTTVAVDLPRAAGAAGAAAAPPESETPGGRETVLLVEDEAQVRRLAERMLVARGYTVLAAGDGEAALELLRGGRRVDLLLTDIIMPGMDGAALAEKAAGLRPGLKVLFMSGFAQHAAVERITRRGCRILSKPFTVLHLAQEVRAALDTPSCQSAAGGG